MRRQRGGFTLVELMVVIGLIGILMALLMPSIRAARRQATSVICASTLRQMASASILHAQEHQGFMPLAGAIEVASVVPQDLNSMPILLSDTKRRRYTYAILTGWGSYTLVPLPGALAPYMASTKLPYHDWDQLDNALRQKEILRNFTCASTDTLSQPRFCSTIDQAITAGQATMIVFTDPNGSWAGAWATNTDYAMNEGVLGFHHDSRYAGQRLRGNLASIRRPEKVVLYSDAKPRTARAFGFFCPWICWTPSLTSTGPVTLADALENNGKAADHTMFDTKRHDGRVNVAFADGHVQTMLIKGDEMKNAYLLPP